MDNAATRWVVDDALFFAVNRSVGDAANTTIFWSVKAAVRDAVFAAGVLPGVVPEAVGADAPRHTLQDFLRESSAGIGTMTP
jgi:hypothetical protein